VKKLKQKDIQDCIDKIRKEAEYRKKDLRPVLYLNHRTNFNEPYTVQINKNTMVSYLNDDSLELYFYEMKEDSIKNKGFNYTKWK
jgi:hypothetical protein